MKLIELHQNDTYNGKGVPIMLDAEKILWMQRTTGMGWSATVIDVGAKDHLSIYETPQQIKAIIEEALNKPKA